MDKQKKKLKFNIIDVAFVAAVLAGLIFVVLRVGGFDLLYSIVFGEDEELFAVTFAYEDTAGYVVERIKLGDRMTDEWMGVDLGEVLEVKLSPAQVYSTRQDGKLVISDKEGYYTISVTGYCKAKDNKSGITVDGLNLGIGHTMVVRIGDAKLWLVVNDIQKMEGSRFEDLMPEPTESPSAGFSLPW